MSAPIIYYAKHNRDLVHLVNNVDQERMHEYLEHCCQPQKLLEEAKISYIKIEANHQYKDNERTVRSAVFNTFGNKFIEKHNLYTELLVNERLITDIKLKYVKLQKSYKDVAGMIRSHGIYTEKPSLFFNNLKEKLQVWYKDERKMKKVEIDQLLRDYNEYLLYQENFGSPIFININSQDCLQHFNYPFAGLEPFEKQAPMAKDAYKLKAYVTNNFDKRQDNNLMFLNSVVGEYTF